MAKIESLNRSITEMNRPELLKKLHGIRAQRRLRPEKKIRESKKTAPAKTQRGAKKGALRQQDLFASVSGMSEEAKLKLAASLLKGILS